MGCFSCEHGPPRRVHCSTDSAWHGAYRIAGESESCRESVTACREEFSGLGAPLGWTEGWHHPDEPAVTGRVCESDAVATTDLIDLGWLPSFQARLQEMS